MRLTASDFVSFHRPSRCDLRVYLRHRGGAAMEHIDRSDDTKAILSEAAMAKAESKS